MIGQDKHKRSYSKPEQTYNHSQNYEKKERRKRFEETLKKHAFTFHEFKVNNEGKNEVIIDEGNEMFEIWSYVAHLRAYYVWYSRGSQTHTGGEVIYTKSAMDYYTFKGRTCLDEIVWVIFGQNKVEFYIK